MYFHHAYEVQVLLFSPISKELNGLALQMAHSQSIAFCSIYCDCNNQTFGSIIENKTHTFL